MIGDDRQPVAGIETEIGPGRTARPGLWLVVLLGILALAVALALLARVDPLWAPPIEPVPMG